METCPVQAVDPEVFMSSGLGICFILGYLAFLLAIAALSALIFCKIFSKAGYHWAMGLLVLVPLGNLVVLLVLAFAEWPILKELRSLRQPQPAATDGQTPIA